MKSYEVRRLIRRNARLTGQFMYWWRDLTRDAEYQIYARYPIRETTRSLEMPEEHFGVPAYLATHPPVMIAREPLLSFPLETRAYHGHIIDIWPEFLHERNPRHRRLKLMVDYDPLNDVLIFWKWPS